MLWRWSGGRRPAAAVWAFRPLARDDWRFVMFSVSQSAVVCDIIIIINIIVVAVTLSIYAFVLPYTWHLYIRLPTTGNLYGDYNRWSRDNWKRKMILRRCEKKNIDNNPPWRFFLSIRLWHSRREKKTSAFCSGLQWCGVYRVTGRRSSKTERNFFK